MPVTLGGGTARLKQVKQRCNETQATFCLLNSLGFLINSHLVITINPLLQVLGIQKKNPQFNAFGEKPLTLRSAKSVGFHKIQTFHLLMVFMYTVYLPG